MGARGRGMKIKTRGINLLPKEYIRAQKVKKYILIAAMLILLECLVFMVTIVIPPISLKKHEENVLQELEFMKNDVRFSEVNQILNQLEGQKTEFKLWSDQYHTLKQNDFIHTALLDSLIARLPVGMSINQLELISAEQKISIAGKTNTIEALLNYVVILESLFKQAQIEFNVSEAQKGEQDTRGKQSNFTLTLTVSDQEVKDIIQSEAFEEATIYFPEGQQEPSGGEGQ